MPNANPLDLVMTIPAYPKGISAVVMIFTLILLGLARPSSAVEPLRIGMVPDAGATQVSVEQKVPLRRYLEQQLGMAVTLIIPTSYNATVEGLGNGSLDVAYLGGLTYVKAHERYGAIPLAQRDVDQQFHALFVTRVQTGIEGLKDLKGKTFCFGDINSTSGHLFPYLAMQKAGISVDKDLKSFRYTGSHAATLQAVAAGICDAGSLDETVYHSMIADGKIPENQTRVFYMTPPFADYVWTARKDLDPQIRQKLIATLVRLQPGRDDGVLDILRGKHYVAANDQEYQLVRSVAQQLGLL
jgi:phosphonate transport system substrate-binding protein